MLQQIIDNYYLGLSIFTLLNKELIKNDFVWINFEELFLGQTCTSLNKDLMYIDLKKTKWYTLNTDIN